ncbi:unnamed protein product [Cylicostephanus goldi]|uniref:Transthyretin/hydroxyisourate hydrolase domain-containing protein n=1 Tax=Cylicostephanus goldi TaxID=71465 RepID=A0A3P6R3T0_CYLGO|nr:unnamed protein product [Cylicostephanus goldi]
MGKLLCNRKPAAGVKIELYEKEICKSKLHNELNFHRKLAEVKTDNSGSFAISGTAKELSKIDPQLNIYHNCNYKGPCYQKLKIKIPSEYISKGKQIKKYFKINLELATKFKGQKTDCWSFSNSGSAWETIEPYVGAGIKKHLPLPKY